MQTNKWIEIIVANKCYLCLENKVWKVDMNHSLGENFHLGDFYYLLPHVFPSSFSFYLEVQLCTGLQDGCRSGWAQFDPACLHRCCLMWLRQITKAHHFKALGYTWRFQSKFCRRNVKWLQGKSSCFKVKTFTDFYSFSKKAIYFKLYLFTHSQRCFVDRWLVQSVPDFCLMADAYMWNIAVFFPVIKDSVEKSTCHIWKDI